MAAGEPPPPATPPVDARRLAVACARIADRLKAADVVVLEMAELLEITDYFVLATGTNRRQIRALGQEIVQQMKRRGLHRRHIDGLESGVWVLTDFGDVVVHIFNEEAREYYDLDGLWADAPRLDWRGGAGFESGGA